MHDSGMGKGGNFRGRPLSAYTNSEVGIDIDKSTPI